MLETLKTLWAKWKVQLSIVGGVLILSTVWGTCSYTPAQIEEAGDEAPEVSEEAVEEASNSSEAPAEVEATSTTAETATTTTTENNTVESTGSDN